MPTVTINIADRGTALSQGGTSAVGYMWFELNNGGSSESYGFAPDAQHHDDPFAPGEIYRNDSSNYQSREYSRTIEITQAQYDAMKSFGENPTAGGFNTQYNGITNSCIDFTWQALEKGGLNPTGFEGDIWPTNNIDDVKNIGNPITPPGWTGGLDPYTGLPYGDPSPGLPSPDGSGGANEGGGAAGGTGAAGGAAGAGGTTLPRRDPLVLDLDGDGIETTSTRDGRVVLFDHDADGVKTGTGWVKPDDGWLVLDRNGNGTIDSGRELFGVDTLKSNGQFATDGFDALKDLDANKDGKIDSGDAVFANLRIWRDLNQDGISQANELTMLSANSITGIGVNSTAVNTDLGNGNVQSAEGTFTRSNGATGAMDETNGAAANLDLLVNTFYRQFTDYITLTDQAKALPTLRGSGRVRDLNEAISLSTDLGDWVRGYTQQTTRQGQIDKLDSFIEKWANTSDLKSLKGQADALSGNGVKLTYTLAGLTAGMPAYDDFVRKLGVVERFMGFTYGGFNGEARFTPLSSSSGNLNVSLAAEQISSISLAYDRFKTDIYESLVFETRLTSYSTLLLEDSQGATKFGPLENAFKQAIASDPKQGMIDLIEFISSVGEVRLAKVGWASMGFLVTQLNAASDLGAFSEELSSWSVRLASSAEHNLTGTSRADLLVGTGEADYLYGHDGNDVLLGKSGNDYIFGENGNDVIDGGAGNDCLSGGTGADVYLFGKGSGQDTVYNYDGDAVGANADTIQLGAGITTTGVTVTRSSDNLIISINGSDDSLRVHGYFNADGASSYVVENLKFADGTVWDLGTIKSKVSAAMAGTAGNDTIYGYATNDTIGGGDGNDTVYGYAGDDVLDGGTGADSVQGGDGNDTVKGGIGNDTLYGGNGNDSLQGNEHNDTLYGDAGNDTLDGGSGNDDLSGGAGADVYLFGKGSGFDTVYNSDGDAVGSNADTIQLGAGITTTGVTVTRSSDNLIISINGSDDSLYVQGYFYNDATYGYQVEQIRFADGTIWDVNAVKTKVLAATSENDTLIGYATADTISGLAGDDVVYAQAGNDTIDGGAGNDRLYGEDGDDIICGGTQNDRLDGGNGNDTLDGGAGDDALDGGAGNDIYLFGKGSGMDTISAYDDTAGKVDVIQLGAGVLTTGVTLTRYINDLVLSINGSTDTLRVNNYFYNDATYGYQVEQIKFADGTIWDVNAVKTKVQVVSATSENDTLTGYATADTISSLAGDDAVYAGAGNDTIDGGAGEDQLYGEDGDDIIRGGTQNDRLDGGNGNDTLQGQDGNDTLDGGAGNDTLDGGAGNDTLYGREGNDIYLFGKDSGQDTITGYDGTAGKVDVIQLGAGVLTTGVTLTRDNYSTLVLSINGSTDTLSVYGYFYNDAAYGGQVEQIKFADGTIWDVSAVKTKVLAATGENDTLTGYATADTISGLAGDDTVHAGAGNDTIDGGAGVDLLYGEDGDDIVRGGTQNDRLDGGVGNDTLDGGAGDDALDGGAGNDIYLFGKGSGMDTISAYDDTAGKVDVIQLGAGVLTTGVTLTRDNYSTLVLSINGSTDTLRVNNYFYNDATYGYQVEQIRFADGTIWDVNAVKTKVLAATSENDTLTGYATADTISGLAGDDAVYAGAGNDTIDGGAGDDTIDGGAGNDTLDGGAGNDTLYGREGNDIYLFGKGSGQDTIISYDDMAGKVDAIQLGAGVLTTGVTLKRYIDDLVLSINGSSDTLSVYGYFYYGATYGYQVEQIRFADGTIWDVNAVKTKVLAATSENDTLTGYATADTISGLAGDDVVYAQAGNDTIDGGAGVDVLYGEDGDDTLDGGAGNDTLDGGGGNDTLDGGAGNDTLDGGAGNDIYLFGKGSNSDAINNNYYDSTGNDRIVFGAGVSENQIWLQRTGNDLQFALIETNDKLTVRNWYSAAAYHVDGFDLGNGKHLLESQVDALVSAMAAFAPPTAGQTTLPADYQAALNPVIAANWK